MQLCVYVGGAGIALPALSLFVWLPVDALSILWVRMAGRFAVCDMDAARLDAADPYVR